MKKKDLRADEVAVALSEIVQSTPDRQPCQHLTSHFYRLSISWYLTSSSKALKALILNINAKNYKDNVTFSDQLLAGTYMI